MSTVFFVGIFQDGRARSHSGGVLGSDGSHRCSTAGHDFPDEQDVVKTDIGTGSGVLEHKGENSQG